MNSKLNCRLHRALLLMLGATPLGWAQAQTELIVNGGFESGSTGWVLLGSPYVATPTTEASVARSGTNFLWFGGAEYETDEAYQTITVPANAVSCTLSFYYNIISEEGNPALYDLFSATIRDNNGALLAIIGHWSNIDQDPDAGNPYYHQKTFDLLPYKGQAIRIRFASSNDPSLVTSFFVDDVSVQAQTVVIPPPTNDRCTGAVAMAANVTYSVNTDGATEAGDPVPPCPSSFGKGVWYTFTPAVSGVVTISTCGSDFDTALQVYTGACGSLSALVAGCDDDNGPACTGNRASVGFVGTGGVTYYILAGGKNGASGNLSILATVAPPITGGLKIIPTFDSSISTDPQATKIEAAINYAIGVFESRFSDPITVSITFENMNSGLAASSTYYQPISYSSYRAALASHATTADDTTALAHLPATATNPVNGNGDVNVHLPLARALGFSAATPPGQTDSTISLNLSVMNFSAAETDTHKFSLFAGIAHEIDEALGMGSALNGLNNGDLAPTGPITPEDLFRYDAGGARSFTTALSAIAYFSLDGTSHLAQFNQVQGGDFQDWYSFYGGQTPGVQDAFAVGGAYPVLGVELRVLDVLGYHLVTPLPPPTLQYARQGMSVVLSWPTDNAGFALQMTTNLLPGAWSTVATVVSGTNNVATNAISGPRKFYRLKK